MLTLKKCFLRVIYDIVEIAIIASLISSCTVVDIQREKSVMPEKENTTVIAYDGSSSGAYLAGRHAMQVYDFVTASSYYNRILQMSPRNTDLVRCTYMLLAITGNIDDAASIIHRLKISNIEDQVATIILAIKAAKDGRYTDVEQVMTRYMPNTGTFVKPLIIAWAQAGQGRIDAALQTIASLRISDDLSILYHFHSGMLNELACHITDAALHYKMVLDNSSKLSLQTVEVIGAFYLRNNQIEKAHAVYNRYTQEHQNTALLESLIEDLKNSTHPPISVRTGFSEVLFGIAHTMKKEHASEAALLFTYLALAVQDDFPLAQVLAGDILQRQARFSDANAVYQSIRKGSTIYYYSQLRLAENLYRIENIDEAIAILDMLSKQWLDRSGALIIMGDLLRYEKHFSEAALSYEQALSRIPIIGKRHWSLLYKLGVTYERMQKWSTAEGFFFRALELRPNHPGILNYLGYSWLERRVNLEQAKNILRISAAQRPRDGFIIDSLGWALYLTGNYQGAIQELEKAIELQAGDPTINDHLGDVYWYVGRYKEAIFQWQRAFSSSLEDIETRRSLYHKLKEKGIIEPGLDNMLK